VDQTGDVYCSNWAVAQWMGPDVRGDSPLVPVQQYLGSSSWGAPVEHCPQLPPLQLSTVRGLQRRFEPFSGASPWSLSELDMASFVNCQAESILCPPQFPPHNTRHELWTATT
jgi:hypothetical protein